LRGGVRMLQLAGLALAVLAMLAPRSDAAARIRPPALTAPAQNAAFQSLPTFQWAPVRGARLYQFQLAADPRFGAIVSHGTFETHNTAASVDLAVPNGTYYWRVRGITVTDSAGPWSRVRRLAKAWTGIPQLYGPNLTTVNWPSQPLVFSWSRVPYASKYLLVVATDSALANQVIGSATLPILTQGTVYTPSSPLTPGTYFWAVTPLDGEGHKGRRSPIGSFTYAWPTATTTSLSDLNPDPRVFDPRFSWAPVPGAARYEVEVNAAAGFPPGSKWCCSSTTLGTSMEPLQVLANNSYYWRVRALDVRGNAGVWNYGGSFQKDFDSVQSIPSIQNLQVIDPKTYQPKLGSPPSTDTPLVTWSPVPGASSYQVQLTPFQALGCDWSLVAGHPALQAFTATTAWTPLGDYLTHRIGPPAWPNPQGVAGAVLAPGQAYCLRVLARSDNDAQLGQVVSTWTQLGGPNAPAFYYAPPPLPGSGSLGLTMPAGNYHPLPYMTAGVVPRTPFFTWDRVSGAQGYFVVISRDQSFTQIADVGYTNVPAYAPQIANASPLADETTLYYWVVMPTANTDGTGEFSSWNQDSPQRFNKSSARPSLLAPGSGAVVSTQPTFQWSAAESARTYTLQVSSDASFSPLLDNVTTDATAYTSNTTYPANTQLYWRVRANDWIGQGLNWSATGLFVRTLPIPVPSQSNPTTGELIPVLNWSPVQGATGYDIHVDWVDGTTSNFTLSAPAFTAVRWTGVGVWRWQVRADYPSSFGGTVTSGYSPSQVFVRTLQPPSGAHGVKTATRLMLWWNPDPAAKQYEVDVSTSDGFAFLASTHRTDNTSWAPDIDLTQRQYRGVLYWRVAAIDSTGNVGTFATGSFGKPLKHRRRHH
jgi:hypothetical protein